MRRAIASVMVCAALAGCIGAPALYRDADLQWTQVTVPGTPAQVFSGVMERTRRCGHLTGDLLPQGSFIPGASEQVLDLALQPSNIPNAYGRLRMTPTADGTLVRIGVPASSLFVLKGEAPIRASLLDLDGACS